MNQEEIGDSFYNQAVSTLNKFNWWFIGPSKEDREKDAIEYFSNAGDQYKLGKLYKKAGDSYYRAASLYCNRLELLYSARYYTEAANMYESCKNNDIEYELAYKSLQMAIKIYKDLGSFENAGKCTEQLIEMESNYQEKVNLYYMALSFYEASSYKFVTIRCMEKFILLLIDMNQYMETLSLLKSICLLQTHDYLLYDYFLSINIINLYLNDIVACRKTINEQLESYPGYVNDRGFKFFEKILDLYERHDDKSFFAEVKEYKLKPWQHHLLISIHHRVIMNDDDDLT